MPRSMGMRFAKDCTGPVRLGVVAGLAGESGKVHGEEGSIGGDEGEPEMDFAQALRS